MTRTEVVKQLRPATKDDYEYFYNAPVEYTVRAYVLEDDGTRIGIGGMVLVKGQYTVFLNKKENISDIQAWRAIKLGLKLLKIDGIPVLAIRDKNIKSSTKLLKKLGFNYIIGKEEEVYIL